MAHYAIVTNPDRVEPNGPDATIFYNVVYGGDGVADPDVRIVALRVRG